MHRYQNMSFVDYRQNYYERQDHTLLDVRSTFEYYQGHVPGAINIPLDQLNSRVTELDRSKPIVVICATGNRSQTGANILAGAGYNSVYNLEGGTMVWMMNGLPLDH